MDFSKNFILFFNKNKCKNNIYIGDLVNSILTECLTHNIHNIENELIKNYQKRNITEIDLNLAEYITNSRFNNSKSDFKNKVFCLALNKNKFTKTFKHKLFNHFISANKKQFLFYLNKVFDSSVYLLPDDIATILFVNRIYNFKINLTKSQVNYLLKILENVKLYKTTVSYIELYFSLLNYLAKDNPAFNNVIEHKFKSFFSQKFILSYLTHRNTFSILKKISNTDLRYNLAKIFLKEPFINNIAFKKHLLKTIPEFNKFYNLV